MTAASGPPASAQRITVVLRDLPLEIWSGMRQWFEDVQREIALAGFSRDHPSAVTIGRLASILERQTHLLGSADRGVSAMWQAKESGQQHADVTYVVEAAVVDSSRDLAAEIEVLDGLCRSGVLLTLPRTRLELDFTRWYFGEIERQVSGGEPLPWPAVGLAAP